MLSCENWKLSGLCPLYFKMEERELQHMSRSAAHKKGLKWRFGVLLFWKRKPEPAAASLIDVPEELVLGAERGRVERLRREQHGGPESQNGAEGFKHRETAAAGAAAAAGPAGLSVVRGGGIEDHCGRCTRENPADPGPGFGSWSVNAGEGSGSGLESSWRRGCVRLEPWRWG